MLFLVTDDGQCCFLHFTDTDLKVYAQGRFAPPDSPARQSETSSLVTRTGSSRTDVAVIVSMYTGFLVIVPLPQTEDHLVDPRYTRCVREETTIHAISLILKATASTIL